MHYWVKEKGLELLIAMFKIDKIEYNGLVPMDIFLKQNKGGTYQVEINFNDSIAHIMTVGTRKEIVHHAF